MVPRTRCPHRAGSPGASTRLPRQPVVRSEEFDPFWQACMRAEIPVSMHASDSGYSELINVWEPGDEFLPFKPTAFRSLAMGHRPIEDAFGALICHGALSRNPDLRILSIENGADWVPHLFKGLKGVYKKMPQAFSEDPIETFKRCIYVSPFWEDQFTDIVKMVGTDRVVFGSDWPHPEASRTRSPSSTSSPISSRRTSKDHGRKPDEAHEGGGAGEEASVGLNRAEWRLQGGPYDQVFTRIRD